MHPQFPFIPGNLRPKSVSFSPIGIGENWRDTPIARYSSRFQNNYITVLRSGSLEVLYLRLVDFCITHL